MASSPSGAAWATWSMTVDHAAVVRGFGDQVAAMLSICVAGNYGEGFGLDVARRLPMILDVLWPGMLSGLPRSAFARQQPGQCLVPIARSYWSGYVHEFLDGRLCPPQVGLCRLQRGIHGWPDRRRPCGGRCSQDQFVCAQDFRGFNDFVG